MTFNRILAAGILPVLMTAGIFPALAQAPKKVTLSEAIDLALNNNTAYKLAESDLEKADYQISEAYGLAMPTITGSIQYTRNLKKPVFYLPDFSNPSSGKTNPIEIGSDNTFVGSVSLNQPLFSKTVGTALEVAEVYQNYSQEGVQSSKLKTILDVKKAYYSVLLAKKYAEVADKMLALTEANYKNVQAMYKEGVASEFDELRMSVQLSNIRPQVVQAQNGLKLALLNLKNITGSNQDLFPTDEFRLEIIPESDLLKGAELVGTNNPALRQLEIQKNLLELNIQIKEANFWPSLYAFGSLSRQTQANDFKFNSYNWVNSAAVGLTLSVPIFSGFQTFYQVQQAELDVRKIELQRNDIQKTLVLASEQAALKLKESKERYEAQTKAVTQAEKALSIAEIRFKNGVGLQLEILDAQLALNQTLNNQAQAIYEYLVAKAEWQNLTGME